MVNSNTAILKQARERLIDALMQHQVEDFLSEHALAVDEYFRLAYEKSLIGLQFGLSQNPFALIALGGYGRLEHCLHSDIDLLILFEKRVPTGAADLVKEVVYPLWDLGLEVGHATRSIEECLAVAAEDYEVLTSLLDARFICGMSPLYAELMHRFQKKLIHKKGDKIIQWLVTTNIARHERYGDSSYLLKPNLKEGQGGLRDYHTIRWIARIRSDLRHRRDLEYDGHLSHEEYREFDEALRFIWHVRNHLHRLAERKCDQLYFEYQQPLAETLGFVSQNGQQAVERFMGRLHREMECVKHLRLMFLYELGFGPERKGRDRTPKSVKYEGIKLDRGMLFFESPEALAANPELMMWIFEECARMEAPLSPESKRLIRNFSHLVNDSFRSRPSVLRSFERTLVAPATSFNVLGEMLTTGFLVSFIPDYSLIENRMQYDEYHLFPVDRHSVRVVHTLKAIGGPLDRIGSELCTELMTECKKRRLLMWAGLLHDIGKGVEGADHSHTGASLVRRILTERGLHPRDVEMVAFLVAEHLLLIKTASRRDVNDEETAIACARKIKDTERLKMLYLLTVADSVSTGPKAWNDWTGALLRDFFLKVLAVLEKGELASREAVRVVDRKRRQLIDSVENESERVRLTEIFNVLSPRYLLAMSIRDIREHIELYEKGRGKPFVWDIHRTRNAQTRTVTICAQDRPGLISKIAGTCTLHGIDILSVQAFTWRNNIALDIFTVTPPLDLEFETEKWQKAEADLNRALSGELNLSEAISRKLAYRTDHTIRLSQAPPKIRVDNESSSFFTIVEVFSYDFPGLLYKITDALFSCGLDVWVAKIATKVDQVVDVFYVRDFDGQKVDGPAHVELIKNKIGEVLTGSQFKEGNDEKN
jgi:[protein-PII] uridylyltransferase